MQRGRLGNRPFTLSDVPALEAALERHPGCLLIVIDPLSAYLGSDTDSHKHAEVRELLAPLVKLAADHREVLL